MFSVALIGPDGAGKTTIGRQLERALARPVTYLYMGVNLDSSNQVLPTTSLLRAVRRWMGAKPDKAGPRDHRDVAAKPGSLLKKIARAVRSSIGLVVRLSEELYRHGLAWYHRSRGRIVLFDRCYFCDYYAYDIEPKSRHDSLNRRIHGFMLKHVYPKPDLVIYLDAPAEVLFARKGEGSLELLEQRRHEYLDLRHHLDNFAVVDAAKPPNQVATEVARIISGFRAVAADMKPAATRKISRNDNRPTVLVTDSHRGSAIAIIRSLGRRGWRVIAADSHASSVGFQSRYASKRFVYPDPEKNPLRCVEALLELTRSKSIDLIVPVTDSVILPLSAARDQFRGSCQLALPESRSLEMAADKRKTLEIAERLGVPVPGTHVVETVQAACEKAQLLGWPVVLKPQSARLYRERSSIESYRVCYAENMAGLAKEMKRFEGRCPVLLQEFVRGEGHGVELLTYRGKPLAAFQHRRIRELPISGGPSAFRESVQLDPTMYAHSVRLLEELEWTGLAMVEFKVGAGGPKLMEINGRVWGSLPLAIHSGVDFPLLMAELFLYGPPENGRAAQSNYKVGIRGRNLELDLMWIASVLAGRSRYPFLAAPRRRQALAALRDLVNPTNRFDIQSLDDPGPGLADLSKIFRAFAGKLSSGLAI